FRISLKCANRESLSASTGGMELGTTLVYSAPAPVSLALGWNQFTFDVPYSLDSNMGLIVEICYSNSGTIATLPQVNAVPTPSTQMVMNYSNVNGGNLCTNPNISNTTVYHSARPMMR